MWPLPFAAPGQECVVLPKLSEDTSSLVERITVPSTVVAVARFSNANPLIFASTISFSAWANGKGKVWIPLQESQHPWRN
jgi:hypothetical protein